MRLLWLVLQTSNSSHQYSNYRGIGAIADAIMGFAIDFSLDITMVACGALLMVLCGILAVHPQSRVVNPTKV